MKDVYETISRARKVLGFVSPKTNDLIHKCLEDIEQGDLLACFTLDDIMNDSECRFVEESFKKFEIKRTQPASFEGNMELLRAASNLLKSI